MYILKTEHSFDSAHFLAGYEGKCANIHGHRWRVEIEVQAEELVASGQLDGMVVDFGDLKKDLKAAVDHLDHALIIEQGTMREQTLHASRKTVLPSSNSRSVRQPRISPHISTERWLTWAMM